MGKLEDGIRQDERREFPSHVDLCETGSFPCVRTSKHEEEEEEPSVVGMKL